MKFKKALPIFGLVTMLGLGVGVGLASGQKPVAEVKAETPKTFYLDCTGHDWDTYDSICLHLWGSTPGDKYYQATCVGDNYWYVTIPDISGFSGAEFYKCNSVAADHNSATNLYNKQSWLTFPSNNYYYTVVSDSYGDDDKNWSAPVTSVSVTGTHFDDSPISQNLSLYKFDGSGLQGYTMSLSLQDGDVFTASNGTASCGFDDLRSYGGLSANEKGLVVDDGNGNIEVVHGGTFEFYMNVVTGSAWLQPDSASEAEAWAKQFVLGIGCNGSSKPANWDRYASNSGTYSWSLNLTDGAKYLFVTAEASNDDSAPYLQQAAFIHDMCVRKYDNCNVFMSYSGGSRSGNLRVVPSTVETTSNNSTLIVVISASIVAVIAVGGYFFFRKRRQD